MRLSRLFFKTFKEAPAEADALSHKLLERAGYIKKVGKGLYTHTPLMTRVIYKLSHLIREEMDLAGCQEIHMPHLHPAEIWKKTGRFEDYKAANILFWLKDRENTEMVLGPTHEEIVTHLAINWLVSYRQLPVNLYQIADKFRDEIRPRFGLMRSKEFLMKDAYSFSKSEEQMEEQYQIMRKAYTRVLERLGLDFAIVSADSGKIGKGKSEEFQILADIGEDSLLIAGDKAYNVEAAKTTIENPKSHETEKPLEERSTPGISTIEALSAFLKIPATQIVKTMIFKLTYKEGFEFVAIGIRGDREVNAVKVVNYFKALEAEPALVEEVEKATKAPHGFAGPINLPLPYYADLSCKDLVNFVVGANKKDHHFLNVSWERDAKPKAFHDFLTARSGDLCPDNRIPYSERRGIEMGHIFNLGTRYSESMGALFQDDDGSTKPLWMGSYGIGVGRLAAACIEAKADDKGLVWPLLIAPYHVVVVAAKMDDSVMREEAERVYEELLQSGTEALLDDREERLGHKLKDADLLGIPYKIIVGKRFVEEGLIELEPRQGEKRFVKPELKLLQELFA